MKGYRTDRYGLEGSIIPHKGIFRLVRDNGSRGTPAVEEEAGAGQRRKPRRKTWPVEAKVEKALREAGGRELTMKQLYALHKGGCSQVVRALNTLWGRGLISITNKGAKRRVKQS